MSDGEHVEHTQEEQIDEAATGRRWGLSIVLIVLGIAGIAAGIHYDRTILILGGIFAIFIFGWIAAGSSGFQLSYSKDSGFNFSARLPRRHRTRTEVRRRGFPKKGRSPLDPPPVSDDAQTDDEERDARSTPR